MTHDDSVISSASDIAERAARGGRDGCGRRLVIVAGYGPVGRVVVDMLEGKNVEIVMVEMNLATIERQLDLDKRVVYGDITDEATQRAAGVDRADALILTIPNERAAVLACEIARKLAPDIFIAARTNFVSQGMLASQAGADYVVIEEVVTANAMKDAVLERFLMQNGGARKSAAQGRGGDGSVGGDGAAGSGGR